MKEKDPDKIPAIFQATVKRVGEVGLMGLRMADIAKTAKIASGTLYLYFASKEDLLNALYRHLKTQQTFLFAPSAQEAQQPLKLRLKNIWAQSLRFRLAHLNQMLNQGKQQILLKDLDNALLLCLLWGFLKETAHFCKWQGAEITEELIEQSFELCWDAIRA